MAITPLPSLDRTSATFRTDCDTFFATKLPTFSTEVEAARVQINTNATTASDAATTATNKAAEASASANSAAAVSGATKWISGTTYGEGACVWSPANFQTYRRKSTGAGVTDPSLDATNWEALGNPSTLAAKTLTSPKYSRDDDGTVSGGTWAIDYANGPVIKATAGANVTSITMANWPATGTAGHLRLMLVNFGAYTITFPAAWKWVKSDLTTTTTFADLSLTLPSAGTAIVDLFSDDGGTTIYATVLRG